MNDTKKTPSLIVIGTVAVDEISSPAGSEKCVFGGSASYFSYASSFFSSVGVVAVVGEDFPKEYRAILDERSIDLSHLKTLPGKTFHWKGKYENDLNAAITLDTKLNVLLDFEPVIEYSTKPEVVFLANIDPDLQLSALDQVQGPELKFAACDTMNFWIESKRESLIKVLARVNAVVLNDGEARQLTGEPNLIKAAKKVQRLGPEYVIIKKGEHGALLYHKEKLFVFPAFPLESVFDPTGAGDSFAGGMMGYLTKSGVFDFNSLKQAIAYGTVVASFTVEKFGLERLREIKFSDFEKRLAYLKQICKI